LVKFAHPTLNAGFLFDPVAISGQAIGHLRVDSFAKLDDFPSPMECLDDLFRPERDQHADDDDTNLAHKRAPAVQRFWQLETHECCPLRGTLRPFRRNG
jgi:hypothetical protein